MSDCETTRAQISEAFDERRPGELPPAAVRHLEDCVPCQDFRAESAEWDTRLSRPVSAEGGESPEGMHARIMAAVEMAGAPEPDKVVPIRQASWPMLGGIAAAAAAVVFALAVKWNGDDGDQPAKVPGGGVAEVVTPEPVPEPSAEPGLPTGFEVPLDVRGLTAAVERRFAGAYNREAEALASDMGKLRDYFGSRLRRGS